MYDESWELESLRRSLVMCAPEGPATSLTNRDASQLISRVQAMEEELKMLRSVSGNGPALAGLTVPEPFCRNVSSYSLITKTPIGVLGQRSTTMSGTLIGTGRCIPPR